MHLVMAEQPRAHRWTAEEYVRLGELGYFHDRRVQLVEGRIIDMPPQKNSHVFAVQRCVELLTKAFGPDFWVRSQGTLKLDRRSAPDPDVAVVVGVPHSDASYPTSAVLVVEVSDTTLRLDQKRKSRIYARAKIGEYWIVNLVDRQLEVHREPIQRPTPAYRSLTYLKPAEFVTALAAPDHAISVARLFD